MQTNTIHCGEAAAILKTLPEHSIDLVVTDPPYLVNYRDRTGRSLENDNNPDGILPVFEPMARAMKPDSYAVCFSGWTALPQFSAAWEAAGLRIVSQIVWAKRYSSRRGYTEYRHESAYVLANGNPAKPAHPLPSVMDWVYSGNRRHPTEKAVEVITPLIRCFSKPGDLVCDPFSGSGSTSVAAALSGRDYIGIEIDPQHVETAKARLAGVARFQAQNSGRAVACADRFARESLRWTAEMVQFRVFLCLQCTQLPCTSVPANHRQAFDRAVHRSQKAHSLLRSAAGRGYGTLLCQGGRG